MKRLTWLIALLTIACAPYPPTGYYPSYTVDENEQEEDSTIKPGTYSFGKKCPSCSMNMIFTGNTKTEWGKLFQLYKCPAGHSYWYPMLATPQKKSNLPSRDYNESTIKPISVICPVCNMSATFTGKTRLEWGKLQYIYRCPSGHISVK